MAYAVTVRIGRVVCHDRESLSEYDAFALTGAVVVDGHVHGFALEPVAVNERIAATYVDPIYRGRSQSRQIGLVLRGYDIDDNDRWKKHRAAIQETSDRLADAAEYVPVVGEYAALLLKHWPKVVDLVVSLDKDDLLLSVATAVDLPEVSPTLFRDSHHSITVRGRRSDRTGYSDWDYTVPVHFSYANLDVPSFGQVAATTHRPRKNSRAAEWVGVWESAHVTCHVTPSARGADLLDVRVVEQRAGRSVETSATGVAISRPVLDQLVVEAGAVDLQTTRAGAAEEGGLASGTVLGRAARQNPVADALRGGLDTDRLTGSGPVLGRDLTQRAVVGPWREQVPTHDRLVERVPATEREGMSRHDKLVERVPVPERSGGDFVELPDDAVLEIYRILHDGRGTPGRQLRYRRPLSPALLRATDSVDELLSHRLDLH